MNQCNSRYRNSVIGMQAFCDLTSHLRLPSHILAYAGQSKLPHCRFTRKESNMQMPVAPAAFVLYISVEDSSHDDVNFPKTQCDPGSFRAPQGGVREESGWEDQVSVSKERLTREVTSTTSPCTVVLAVLLDFLWFQSFDFNSQSKLSPGYT